MSKLKDINIDHRPMLIKKLLREQKAQNQKYKELRIVLRNLVDAIASDELLPESTSFMRDARAVLVGQRAAIPMGK